ncbi:MAG: hypothetical protein IJD60_04755 [Clostridia bacterium]|nr:hypothetical protein [Clostridia bacterium]
MELLLCALAALAAVILGVHYRAAIMRFVLPAQVLRCFGSYLVYLAAWLTALLLARRFLTIPRELWRKLLHLVAYTSSLFMMAVSGEWLPACVCCLIFAAVVYPVLHHAERLKGYADLFIQRRPGEVKKSLLLLFGSHAAAAAPVAAYAELISHGGSDTVNVPAAAAAFLSVLSVI